MKLMFLLLFSAVACGDACSGIGEVSDKPVTADQLVASTICSESFVELGGGCFYFHESPYMNWHDSRDYCRGLSDDDVTVDLATVDDCNQASLIYQHILMEYGQRWHWLGGSDEGQESNWHWVTGAPVPMGHPFWYPNYPDNYPDNDCLAINRSTGYWVSYGCENTGPSVCRQF